MTTTDATLPGVDPTPAITVPAEHFLVVEPPDILEAGRKVRLECAGPVTDDCRLWMPCKPCESFHEDGPDVAEFTAWRELLSDQGIAERHGERHYEDEDGELHVPTVQCLVSWSPAIEAARDFAFDFDLAPGRYPVKIHTDEGYPRIERVS